MLHTKWLPLVIVTPLLCGLAIAVIVEPNDNNVVAKYIMQQQSHGWYQSRLRMEHQLDSVLNIEESTVTSPLFERNYPRPTNLCVGLNDTLVLELKLMNRSYETIILDKNPEAWIAPRLFDINTNIEFGVPAIDSTELQYNVRRWVWRGRTLPDAPPDSLTARKYEYNLYLNVWGFPEGQWVLSAGVTEHAIERTNVLETGMEFQYYPAKDAQDSVNAFIGCAERAMLEYDFNAAQEWVKAALDHHPYSVPAWWERAALYVAAGDSLAAVQAFDSALYYLAEFKDPLLPDTTKQVSPIERQFMRYISERIPEDLYFFQNPY